jgi:hypothetical protein
VGATSVALFVAEPSAGIGGRGGGGGGGVDIIGAVDPSGGSDSFGV